MEVEFGLVANKMAEHNGQCFIVGSYYRDMIENNIGSEYHIATDLLPNEILDIFSKFVVEDYSNILGNIIIKINTIIIFFIICSPIFHGSIVVIISKSAVIIGIDILIIIIFPPKSILLAIAVCPASLQILVANSVRIAIPVIFNNIFKNSFPA